MANKEQDLDTISVNSSPKKASIFSTLPSSSTAGESSSVEEYETVEKKGKPTSYIPIATKIKILNMANEHPK
ncbi:hypothetical protein ILUMI_04902 [Ignelater luminosus]|uniref:Uncharacterized protein n=1 Tax=Ignelater luminosus TaxID=2038154 RepID=A0A8K0D8S1_IGNLU|nr:hypothetical protein ILUMI_04902 [Ignelater luminosus]